jgi:uncharacterized phage-associated protein
METGEFSLERVSRGIDKIVGRVQDVLRRERGEYFDERLVRSAICRCVANRLEALEEGLAEMFTTPGRSEFDEMVAIIEERLPVARAAQAVEEMVHVALEHGDDSVFSGYRLFAKSKMVAMIEYLTAKGQNVYKTSLNKLLFYSDLTSYYLRGHGMTGAVYFNRPFGPVAEEAELTLGELVREGKVSLIERTKTYESAAAGEAAAVLSEDDKKLLDWIAETYGSMSASGISELSHREMAYKYTEPNEPIAYAYGKFFKHLPPKDLLGQ